MNWEELVMQPTTTKKINNFNYIERSLTKGQEKETIEQKKNEPKAMNKQFREVFQMPSTCFRNFSNSIVIGDMQIKVTTKYHTPNKPTKIARALLPSFSCCWQANDLLCLWSKEVW